METVTKGSICRVGIELSCVIEPFPNSGPSAKRQVPKAKGQVAYTDHSRCVCKPQAGLGLCFSLLPPEGTPNQLVFCWPACKEKRWRTGVVFINLIYQSLKNFYWISSPDAPSLGIGNATRFPHYRVLNKRCCFIRWGPWPCPWVVGTFGFSRLRNSTLFVTEFEKLSQHCSVSTLLAACCLFLKGFLCRNRSVSCCLLVALFLLFVHFSGGHSICSPEVSRTRHQQKGGPGHAPCNSFPRESARVLRF